MSKKDNISVNDILEEFSPDGHKVDEEDTTTDTTKENQAIKVPIEQPKSLEELELENLKAIAEGKLSDSAINYSTYTNKPNKIIENPTQSKEFNPYYTKSVVKINSRPEPKENTSKINQKEVSNNNDDNTSIEPKKIDSRNDKAKLESVNSKKRNSKRKNVETSNNDDFNIMSENIKKAKAKKQLQIDELNLKYKKDEFSQEKTFNDNFQDTSNNKNVKSENNKLKKDKSKKNKKPIFQRIIDYYTYPVDEPDIAEDVEEILDFQEPIKENVLENEPNIEKTLKKKETFKEFISDLFISKEKTPPRKKETFKERMIDFFTIEDDELTNDEFSNITITSNKNIKTNNEIAKHESINNNSTQKVAREVDELLNNLVDNLPIVEETPKVEPIIEETPKVEPIVEETPKVEPIVEEIPKVEPIVEEFPKVEPIIEETPKVEPIVEEFPKVEPIVEEFPKVEPIIEETPKAEPLKETEELKEDIKLDKKPNVFKRIKMFFLAEELNNENSNDDIEETQPLEETPIEEETQPLEETPIEEKIQPLEETPIEEKIQIPEETSIEEETQPLEETPIEEETQPLKETPIEEETQPLEETPIEEKIQPLEETPIEEKPQEPIEKNITENDDYIAPFSEDTPKEAIDIPIDEPIKYKHFWQDPDFNPIDRFKSYVEDTTEKYKNRKRSGEIHIEIKSNPETAILFSDLKNKVLAEEELIKSREEFQKQVENGEYDDYNENSKKFLDNEPTFKHTSINDFNSYDDKSKIQQYISEMKNSLLLKTIIISILSIISLYITLANDLHLPIISMLNTEISESGYLMVQSAIGLLAILTSIKSVFSGIVKIFKRQADSDSFASIGIVSAFISVLVTFLMSNQLVGEKMLNIYMPIALLGLLSNLIGKSLIVKREENNFKYISKNKSKFGLFCIQDDYDAEKITKGLVEDYPVTTYKKKSEFTSDFIKYTYSYDMADKFSKFAVPSISIVSLIISLISSLVYNRTFDMLIPVGFVSIFSMLISFCSCLSISININSMLYNVSKKYAKRDGVLLGYQAVEDFYDTNSVIINSNDIFPKGSVNISAIKMFSNAKLDETLIYAISLSKKVNSILAPTLLDILDGNFDLIREVENCSYEDGLGICGWIDNKRVLMGNRELMEAHNIENLPSKSKEMELVKSTKDCVYISVSGNLALMLIIDIVPNKKVRQDLTTLQDNNISMAITSCDFLVSINKIRYLFGLNEDNIKVIPYEVFEETKGYFSDKPKCSTSIVTNGDIGMIANMLLSTKKIHRKAILSNMLNAVSCLLGIIIGLSFISMGGFRELTSTMILLYNLICSSITLLICNSKRF